MPAPSLSLSKSRLRNLRVTRTTSVARITNVAVCSGCHGCTHLPVGPGALVRR